MSNLTKLKAASTRDDVAAVLGYKPNTLSYILYAVPDVTKYVTFNIPKKTGGVRTINAPNEKLSGLQKHLANLLTTCESEILRASNLPSLSHGFKKEHSITTNAYSHTGRRFVLNLDLADFFNSFNFGRVRGFFIKNNDFLLNPNVATVLAQIATHENKLPQGSPSSPIITNLITHILDIKLAQLAKKNRCMYSRYADDITFSTNQKEFPSDIASFDINSKWQLSDFLIGKIMRAGFAINSSKTRMQTAPNKQVVTGLSVNRKVNIQADYYRATRSMCNELYKTGTYYEPILSNKHLATQNRIDNINIIEGRVNYIHSIKDEFDLRKEKEYKDNPTAAFILYRNFLNFKNFIALDKPLIICEGKTDNIYLKCALKRLPTFKTQLASTLAKYNKTQIKFFNYSKTTQDVMLLGGGSGDFVKLIQKYTAIIAKYKYCPMNSPVILVIDNDDGAKGIFAIIKNLFQEQITLNSTSDFYHITQNLYLVKTPETGQNVKSCIEDLFESNVTNKLINGKPFNPDKEHGDESSYGKHYFSEKIILKEYEQINFMKFEKLLIRIENAIKHHYQKLSSNQTLITP